MAFFSLDSGVFCLRSKPEVTTALLTKNHGTCIKVVHDPFNKYITDLYYSRQNFLFIAYTIHNHIIHFEPLHVSYDYHVIEEVDLCFQINPFYKDIDGVVFEHIPTFTMCAYYSVKIRTPCFINQSIEYVIPDDNILPKLDNLAYCQYLFIPPVQSVFSLIKISRLGYSYQIQYPQKCDRKNLYDKLTIYNAAGLGSRVIWNSLSQHQTIFVTPFSVHHYINIYIERQYSKFQQNSNACEIMLYSYMPFNPYLLPRFFCQSCLRDGYTTVLHKGIGHIIQILRNTKMSWNDGDSFCKEKWNSGTLRVSEKNELMKIISALKIVQIYELQPLIFMSFQHSHEVSFYIDNFIFFSFQ